MLQSLIRRIPNRSRDPKDQSQSPLFRTLPLELRRLIYAHAVVYPFDPDTVISGDGPDLHIFQVTVYRCMYCARGKVRKRLRTRHKSHAHPPRFCHRLCPRPPDTVKPCGPECNWYSYMGEKRSIFGDLNLLTVALTCRKMYAESLPLLYSQNTFHFLNPLAILSFASAIPAPQLRDSVRNIHLKCLLNKDGFSRGCPIFGRCAVSPPPSEAVLREKTHWDELCDVLARMDGLRRLFLRLVRGKREQDVLLSEEEIFQGLARIDARRGRLVRFEVELDWEVHPDTVRRSGELGSLASFQLRMGNRRV